MKLSLQQEPAIQPISVITVQTKNIASSANDGIFIWKSVAGLASLMGVIAVSWSLFNGTINGGAVASGEMASATAPANQVPMAVVASDTAVAGASNGRGEMLRDAQLDAMIAAHKQLGGYSALQAPSGFLRHATFDKNRP
jgi:sigma-E factor negative regulatory protein RseA